MKALSVCVLFATVCVMLGQADKSPMMLTLKKTMNELHKINKGLAKSTTMFNSPTTSDLKGCCIASTLECFRSQVNNLTTDAKKSQTNIFNDLRRTSFVNSLPTCNSNQVVCKSCETQQKVDSKTFVQNFETLLQMIYASQP